MVLLSAACAPVPGSGEAFAVTVLSPSVAQPGIQSSQAEVQLEYRYMQNPAQNAMACSLFDNHAQGTNSIISRVGARACHDDAQTAQQHKHAQRLLHTAAQGSGERLRENAFAAALPS